MPSGYVIANVKVTDPVQYEEYKKWSTAAFAAHNAEICVRGGKTEVMEGQWQPTRIAMLRFPSLEAAQSFYDAEQYRAARALRAGATEFFNMVVVEGVDAPV